ncbi:hypothetical protein BMT54_00925 [Pasteurellaceae bacterium 15-036681]|nr:hypothetical protein BMT54_00925 [Pasteurellaceae bacterium 15-036681]
MKLFHLSALLISVATLTACSSSYKPKSQGAIAAYSNPSNQPYKTPYSGTATEKRINTTECGDADDWYLDGYRVGRSFTDQKNQMFEQRVNYCNNAKEKLPQNFKANWETGFRVGNKT